MNFDLRVSFRSVFLTMLIGVVALSSASCGGGQGVGAAGGSGQGLVLLSFLQSGLDNVYLNTRLEFRFSEPVKPSTITTASVQIREGPSFGLPIKGDLRVVGASVYFDPQLPSICDYSTSAFKPSTSYRISLIGYPEEFGITNTSGQPLGQTLTYEFSTRPEGAGLFLDQIPGQLPKVLSSSPARSGAAVTVEPGNTVVLEMSENLDPCTIDYSTVRFTMYESGDSTEFVNGAPSGNASGFVPWEDQAPNDPYSWGANGTDVVPPQVIPFTVGLDQDFESTRIRIVSSFGVFPENALLVVELLGGIRDFGGYPLEPYTTSFTTENLPEQEDAYVVENEGETPWREAASTADINTQRSPSLVQGFVLISGDGDNGTQLVEPSSPHVPPDCTTLRDTNDGITDDYEPAGPNATLDTGSTLNTCPNSVDGSNAVVWEFKSFTINPGVTVDIVGVNPAIILVNGPVLIEDTGTLNLAGLKGNNGNTTVAGGARPNGVAGGRAVAGGGDGGRSLQAMEEHTGPTPVPIPYVDNLNSYGKDGEDGYGSPVYGTSGRLGGGAGNAASWFGALPPPIGPYYEGASDGGGGGGGGHGIAGGDGGSNEAPAGHSPFSAPARGNGGEPYDTSDISMRKPSAGSGGGAGGYYAFPSYTNSGGYWAASATAGAGGAGGGFVDITSSFDITIAGTIDASGGRGGTGGGSYYCDMAGGGGGGGGSGGGIRLLTTASIIVSGGTITTAGGLGGSPGPAPTCPNGTVGLPNPGGFGGAGRIVLEDADGVIFGQADATLVPMEGQEGFYRNKFDSSRFLGGGRRSVAVSDPFLVGAFEPTYIDPPEGPSTDFITGIPSEAGDDPGAPQILIEAQGFQIQSDGTADPGSATGWRTVGYFTNSGTPTAPVWRLGQVAGDIRPPDNTQSWGITNLNGCEYIQLRLTLQLGQLAGIDTFGPYLDRWNIRFLSDR